MTKIIFAIAALSFLAVTTIPAKAGCPSSTQYGCYPYGGKLLCGCH